MGKRMHPEKTRTEIGIILDKNVDKVFDISIDGVQVTILYAAARMLIELGEQENHDDRFMLPARSLRDTCMECFKEMGFKDGRPETGGIEGYVQRMEANDNYNYGMRFVVALRPIAVFYAHLAIISLLEDHRYKALDETGKQAVQYLRASFRILLREMGVSEEAMKDLDPLEFDESLMETPILVWPVGSEKG